MGMDWLRKGTRRTRFGNASSGPSFNDLVARSSDPQSIENDAEYALKLAATLVEDLEKLGIAVTSLRTMEVGPGHHAGLGTILVWLGAPQVTVVEKYWVSQKSPYHQEFYATLWEKFRSSPLVDVTLRNRSRWPQRPEMASQIRVIKSGVERLPKKMHASCDLVISTATLEHVSNVRQAVSEMNRVMSEGAFGIHQIDFRDHRDFNAPLDFLLLEEHAFAGIFADSNGECGNRVRLEQWLAALDQASFRMVSCDVNMQADPAYLERFVGLLEGTPTSPFAFMCDIDLSCLSAKLTFQK